MNTHLMNNNRADHIGYTVEKRENNVYIQIEIFRWQYSRGYSQQRYYNIAGNTN